MSCDGYIFKYTDLAGDLPQSRCTRFRFKPLADQFVRPRLQHVVDSEGVKLGAGGMDALVSLGEGDMRRSLNILQSCSMAFDEVGEEAVYLCTGNPMPKDVEEIVKLLFNSPITEAFQSEWESSLTTTLIPILIPTFATPPNLCLPPSEIQLIQVSKGLALSDIVKEIHPFIFRMGLPTKVKIMLIEKLADCEYRLASGTHEKLQLGGLIGAFAQAREQVVKSAV